MIGTEKHAWIGLGGNLGEASATIEEAVRALGRLPSRLPSLKVEAVSGLYRTSPVDASGPDYVNAVARIGTTLSPMEVLRLLQAVENAFGRIRPAGVHHAPRTLDLDLLHYEDAASSTPELTIPHPRMNERLFVLCPLELSRSGSVRGANPSRRESRTFVGSTPLKKFAGWRIERLGRLWHTSSPDLNVPGWRNGRRSGFKIRRVKP